MSSTEAYSRASRNKRGFETCLHSNLGVTCQSINLHHLAQRHFLRAVKANSLRKSVYVTDRKSVLQFNRGLSHLAMNRGSEALMDFQSSSHAFSIRPALWLRLAEACIANREQHTYAGLKGNLSRRKYLECVKFEKFVNPTHVTSCDINGERIMLSCASLLARHALRLELHRLEIINLETASQKVTSQCHSEIVAGAILINAYVHLELDDVAVALEWAESLLSWPLCHAASSERQTLARMYATEARFALGCMSQ